VSTDPRTASVLAEARAVAGREEPRANSPEDVGFVHQEGEHHAPGAGKAGTPTPTPGAAGTQDRREPLSPAGASPPVGECRSCRRPVYWCVTGTGAAMPVDVEPVANGNIQLHRNGERILAVYLTGDLTKVPGPRRVSHFATCKDAKNWRKR
jgi:hypothetical protein